MKRFTKLAVAFLVALAAPLYAADSYRVTVTLYPGDDAAAVAKRLAAIYRGELERPVEPQGDTFVMSIALGAAEASLLSRDPYVEEVQPADATAAIPGPTAPATNAAVPSQAIETHAGSQWTSGEYKYDGSGNIRSIGDDVFLYDGSSRLVYGDAGLDPTTSTRRRQEYSYDGFGNLHTVLTNGTDRTRIAINPKTNRAEYPRDGDGQPQPIPPGGGSYTMAGEYDSRGNLTQVLINSNDRFEYDALDMVTKAYVHEPTLHWQSYIYNASDERIGTIRLTGQNGTDNGSDWTFRDTGGQVLRRLSRTAGGDWSWDEDYIYRGSLLLAAELPDETRHFHLDHLGTPRLITGNGGVELSRHTYYAFGAETGTQTSGEKQFTGHERDSATLDYMHARYYSPQMGRFLSVDSHLGIKENLPEPQRWNRYAYVTNNPIRYTDPDGQDRYQEPGFTKPYSEWSEALRMDENTPTVVKAANYTTGGLTALGAAGFLGVGSAATEGALQLAARFPNAFGFLLRTGVAVTAGVGYGNSQQIRFTQDSIKSAFKDGRTVDGMVEGLKNGSIKPADVAPVRVFMRDGKVFTLDNRRLYAFQQAGVKSIRVVWATAEELARELPQKFTTQNAGASVAVRGQ